MQKFGHQILFATLAISLLTRSAANAESNAVWTQDVESFQLSDDPYKGWKVLSGEVQAESLAPPEAVVFTNLNQIVSACHYVPFLDASNAPESYLQIRTSVTHSGERTHGEAANASAGGCFFGPFAEGITTYTLAQHTFFREDTDNKKNWALKLWSLGKSFRIEEITLTHEITDGLTLQVEPSEEANFPKEGQNILITLHTTDPKLMEQQAITADLVYATGNAQMPVTPFSGSDGQTVELKQAGKGIYTGSITLNSEILDRIKKRPKQPTLGVQVLQGEIPLTGWIAFPELETQANTTIDWQDKVGEDHGSHEKWAKLTQGENLALRKRVRYSPRPNYRLTTDENDPYDLTDGKLSTRKDDRIWFQKDAVGWTGTSGAIGTVNLLIDLEKVEPIEQISIRLLGGKEQGGLRLPNGIEFLASEDGKLFHLLQAMQKLMPAEQNLSDFRTAFYVPEEGKAFVHAFNCHEGVRARYIAIRIHPETSVFSDQIAILKASRGKAMKSLAAYPAKPFFTEGAIAQFRNPELTLFPGVHAQNWVTLESFNDKEYKDLKVLVDLPAGLGILPDSSLKIEPLPGSAGRTIYQVSNLAALTEMRFPLYFEKQGDAQISAKDQAVLTAVVDGTASHRMVFPIQERSLADVAQVENLELSLAWMGEATQLAWPDFFTSFHKLGFNAVSTFPRLWQNRDSQRTWNESAKANGLKLIAEARTNGYKVVMNDSPFHEMLHTFQAAKREGTLKPGDSEGFFLKDAQGQETEHPNPFYRGFFYRQEIQRVRDAARAAGPDQIFWDIELWWKSASLARNDAEVARRWRESGKEWSDFLTDAGTEMLRDLHDAVKEAKEHGPMPIIGLYGAYATEPQPCDGVFEWEKIYPHYITVSMPSLYVQGRTDDVRQRIRDEYSKVQNHIIPWLTAGTYGPVPPRAVESMVLEAVLNGAGGITWFEYRDFDPLHFYHYARAIATLGRFGKLLKEGSPKAYEGDNPKLTYTCFASENEALILVGNYQRSPETNATLPSVFPDAVTSKVDAHELPTSSIVDKTWKTEVPANHYVLYHQKRNQQTR